MLRVLCSLFLLACSGGLAQAKPPFVDVKSRVEKTAMVEIVEFDSDTVAAFLETASRLAKSVDRLYVRINTYGGSIGGGMDVIQSLEQLPVKITCVVDWRAMSMGFILLESEACDERLMTQRAVLMSHAPLIRGGGQAHELREMADSLDALSEGIDLVVAERLGMSFEAYRAKINAREWWMGPVEAYKYKAIDGLVKPKDLPPLTSYSVSSSMMLLLQLP